MAEDDAEDFTFSPLTLDPPAVACSACGRSMTTAAGDSLIGCSISVGFTDSISDEGRETFTASFREIYPELTLPLDINICYVCWLRSLKVTC